MQGAPFGYNIKKLFGARIKSLRSAKNLTQAKIAELTDVDSKHISCIESGKNFPSAELMGRIAFALGVHPKELFEFEIAPTTGELKEEIAKTISCASDSEIEKIFVYSKFITAS